MVVVLTAALAYRYYSGIPPTQIERKLSEQWQKTESFRQSSSDLVKSALCGVAVDEQATATQEDIEDEDQVRVFKTMQQIPVNMDKDVQVQEAVRQEWIDAVFGRDFYASPDVEFSNHRHTHQPPKQGIGNAQVASFTSYTATIPLNRHDNKKVGMTLANIALGVYVRHVEPESQAFCAGICEGSILVSLNGCMGMLGEPTKQALERLWQYEGILSPVARNNDRNGTAEGQRPPPVLTSMTFYYHSSLYTITLECGMPPFGISWASCGNFPLVQRSYSHAAQAGVRRGCLVGAIRYCSSGACSEDGRDAHGGNNSRGERAQQAETAAATVTSMRSMDYQAAAHAIAKCLESNANGSDQGRSLEVTLLYTPPASRPSGVERGSGSGLAAASPGAAATAKSAATSINTTTASNTRTAHAASQHYKPRTALSTDDGIEVRVHPLAYSISTALFPPSGNNNQTSNGSSSPTKRNGDKSASGNSISELAAQVAAGKALAPTGFETENASSFSGAASGRTFLPCPPLQGSITTVWNAWEALAYCLLFYQSSSFQHMVATPRNAQGYVLQQQQQDYEPFVLACLHVVCECSSQQLMANLLDQAEEDDAFRQVLYYLVKSYIATLLDRKTGVRRTVLEILQAAQLELIDRMKEDRRLITVSVPTSVLARRLEQAPSSPLGTQSNDAHANEKAAARQSPGSSGKKSTNASGGGGDLTKKKSVFRVFRKKSSKSLLPSKSSSPTKPKSLSPTSTHTTTRTPTMQTSTTSSPPKTKTVSMSTLFHNMTSFLAELDSICVTVERSLLKSISQKIADWALQPWSLSKHKALSAVTDGMRDALTRSENLLPVVNPIEGSEVLTSVDPSECYILPSAHFPLLLTFHVADKDATAAKPTATSPILMEEERLYRTRVEVVSLRGSKASPVKFGRAGSKGSASSATDSRTFFVQGAVSGVVRESGRSTRVDSETVLHSWDKGNLLTFDTRSTWGAPQTLSLRLSSANLGDDGFAKMTHADQRGTLHYSTQVGFCWVDLRPLWARIDAAKSNFTTVMCHAQFCSLDSMKAFDQHGDLESESISERFEIELRLTTEMLPFNEAASGFQSRKRMLLYKHDDDLRQELFAIEFIKVCDALLKASGLNLELLTFRCIPVGAKQGFIEWIPGSVPLSDICKPADDVPLSRNVSGASDADDKLRRQSQSSLSETARAGLTKFQSLYRLEPSQITAERGAVSNNPIQDFLRSVAYDPDAPYLIGRDVMDTYVKSCAGYCIVTYLLGVGDRHLDNLLLHQTGLFFHCDFSFILGEDPKKYLPMRITEDMVFGMGGKESDNYAMFLTLVGAAFLALRRHENVRVMLSLVRLMVGNKDLSIHDNPDEATSLMRERLRLSLSDTEAVSYIEELIDTSISSKLWKAVDAIHSLGKRF